jgi:hypothetical protein
MLPLMYIKSIEKECVRDTKWAKIIVKSLFCCSPQTVSTVTRLSIRKLGQVLL